MEDPGGQAPSTNVDRPSASPLSAQRLKTLPSKAPSTMPRKSPLSRFGRISQVRLSLFPHVLKMLGDLACVQFRIALCCLIALLLGDSQQV